MQLYIARLEASHFARFPDKPVQPVAFLIDDIEQFDPLAVVELGVGEQTGHGSLHGGEGRPEVMRNRVQQRRLQAFAFASRFGLPDHFDRVRPLDGDGDQRAQRLERLPREHGARDAHAAENARSQTQRGEANAVLLVNLQILARDDRSSGGPHRAAAVHPRTVYFLFVREK